MNTLLWLLLTLPVVICKFVMDNSDLSHVPHSLIPMGVKLIRLTNNRLVTLGNYEFSAYTSLTQCTLSGNRIEEISATAFLGTLVENVGLLNNRLLEFPDLCSVNATLTRLDLRNNRIEFVAQERLDCLGDLEELAIRGNRLQTWPDVTHVGHNVCLTTKCKYSINNVASDLGTATFCHFSEWKFWGLETDSVPLINCSEAHNVMLEFISFAKNGYTDHTDLANLTSFADFPRKIKLILKYNKFTLFPNLPEVMRGRLKHLDLTNNQIAVINGTHLAGYELEKLRLSGNSLVTILADLLYVTKSIYLENNPNLKTLDSYSWTTALCDPRSYDLLKIDLSGSLDSVADFPDISASLSTRSNSLTIYLRKIPVPCDWSVGWMKQVQITEQADFVLDELPCGVDSWEQYTEETPDNFLLRYADEEDNTDIGTFLIRGHEMLWHVYSSPAMLLSEPHWILGEGMYKPEHGYVIAEEAHIDTHYDIIGIDHIGNDTCWSPHILADGLNSTCVNITDDVTRLTLQYTAAGAPRESDQSEAGPGTLVTVTTNNLPCWVDFHVTVTVRDRNTCPLQRCARVGRVLVTDQKSSCTFQCPYSQRWEVRLVRSPHYTAPAEVQLCELIPEFIGEG